MTKDQIATFDEIHRQPAIWRGWAQAFAARAQDLRGWIKDQNPDEIWLCGAGTSAFIGDLVASQLNAASPVPIRSVPTTDFVSTPRNFAANGLRPLVISFGRSGNSAESIGTLDHLDVLLPDAPRLNITCNKGSVLATRAPTPGTAQQVILLPDSCHDSGFAMTSSYTTMLLTALSLLDPAAKNTTLMELASAADSLMEPLFAWAGRVPIPERAVFIGSGALTFAARECALKVMELTAGKTACMWESCLGFRHGPKSFVTPDTRVFVLLSPDPYTAQYDRDMADEIDSQFGAGTVATFGPQDGAQITIPDIGGAAWSAPLYVLVGQILAAVWSERMGLNVDDPFAGQGTLTRVVSGVKLYQPKAL